jgi:DNA polymerase-3 subunit beta
VKLTCIREDLLGPLQAVMPAIATKAQIPILGNVLLTGGDFLSITATNLETQIKSRADVQADGGFGVTVPARKLFDILRLAPEGATVKMESDDNGKFKVKAGPSRYTLATMPVDNFPAFVASDTEQSVVLPAESLLRGFKRVAFCMAVNDVRYYLNGILISLNQYELRTAASDGHRLALQLIQLPELNKSGEEGCSLEKILPRDSTTGIIKFLSEAIKATSGQAVRLSIGVNTASVTLVSDEGDGTQFSTKLIEGKYPHVERVIPKETSTRFTVPVSALVSSIQRAGVVSDGKNNQIQVDIAQDQLSVLSANSEGEQASEEMAITLDGEPLTLGFNGAYLLDALNVVEADLAELKLSEKSGLVLDPNDSGWLSVVMPMRL